MKYSMVIIIIILTLIIAGFLYFQFGNLFGKKHSHPDNLISYWYSPAERDSIKKVLIGEWLEKDYNDALIKTKSPRAAHKLIHNSTYLQIENVQYNDNIVHMETQEGFHLRDTLSFELARSDSLIFRSPYVSNASYLRIPSIKKDGLYFQYAEGNEPVFEVEYIKIPPIHEYVNSIVLAGTYINIKSPEDSRIVFNKNGTMNGLKGLTKYYITLDWYGSDYDRIGMSNAKGGSAFVFEVKDNLLYLYDCYDDPDGYHENKGELLYTLQKVTSAK